MKKLVLAMFAAFAAVAVKGEVAMDQTGKGAEVKTYNHVMTPERRKAIEERRKAIEERRKAIKERREALRKKLEAMTPEQREAYRAERRKRIEEIREKSRNSPRRVVKRTVAEDGTITIERADGTVEIHKIVKKENADK